jgi:hypothetical protein
MVMTSRLLKDRASVNDQIKMLARVAKQFDRDPRHPIDAISALFNFNSEQMRMFMVEYRKPTSDGDDPLEV